MMYATSNSTVVEEVDAGDDSSEDTAGPRRLTRGQARIEFEQLAQFFHVPINEAAKGLGVCATVLKKVCRKHGIPRWPHRKIKKIDTMLTMLETAASKSPNNPQHEEEIRRKIDCLVNERTVLMTVGKGVEGSGSLAEQKKQNQVVKEGQKATNSRKKRKRDDTPEEVAPQTPARNNGAPVSQAMVQSRPSGDPRMLSAHQNHDSYSHNHPFPPMHLSGYGGHYGMMGMTMGSMGMASMSNMGVGMNMAMGMGMGMMMPQTAADLHANYYNSMQQHHHAPPSSFSHKYYRHDSEHLPLNDTPVNLHGNSHGADIFQDTVQHNETHFRLLGVDIPLQSAHPTNS